MGVAEGSRTGAPAAGVTGVAGTPLPKILRAIAAVVGVSGGSPGGGLAKGSEVVTPRGVMEGGAAGVEATVDENWASNSFGSGYEDAAESRSEGARATKSRKLGTRDESAREGKGDGARTNRVFE